MNSTDIARTRRQVEKVANRAKEIVDDSETIADAGFDPSSSAEVLEAQRALIAELGQALADFNELTNRAETIERTVEYAPGRDAFDITYDETNAAVAVEYTGAPDIDAANITVTAGTAPREVFSGTVSTGTTATLDVTDLSDGDRVVVEWPATRVTPDQVAIKPWGEVTGSTDAPEITVSGLDLPSHNLVPDRETFATGITIGTSSI